MPDIKTALEKALSQTANAWAADDKVHQQIEPQQDKPMTQPQATPDKRIKNNVSRITFEYVRDNPGLTVNQITTALVAQGFKPNSVSSLCYQMVKVRLAVSDANGKLTAVVQEYAPIQTGLRRRKAKAKAASPARKHVEIVNTRTGEVINPRPAAPVAEPAQPRATPTPQEWTVESVIGSLNVRQAMAVYDELRKIFGG